MKNTGKPTEDLFEAHLDSYGKYAYYYRLPDAAEIRGRTGKIGQARPTPSDYIVVLDRRTRFVEVKSTTDEKRFSFSLLRPVQSAAAKRVLAAGGDYEVVIHSIAHNRWFWLPYAELRTDERRSIAWDDFPAWREMH